MGQPPIGENRTIVEQLVTPASSIDIGLVPIRLLSESYDSEQLTRDAIQRGYANEFGYLVDIAREIALAEGYAERIPVLQQMIDKLLPHVHLPPRVLYKEFAEFSPDFFRNRTRSPAAEKWGIVASLTASELSDYVRDYLPKQVA